MLCQNYIHCLCKSHGWELKDKSSKEDEMAFSTTSLIDTYSLHHQESNCETYDLPYSYMEYETKRIVPIPSDCIERMYKETGLKEHTTYHKILETKMGFSYCTLLGEVMYAYITF